MDPLLKVTLTQASLTLLFFTVLLLIHVIRRPMKCPFCGSDNTSVKCYPVVPLTVTTARVLTQTDLECGDCGRSKNLNTKVRRMSRSHATASC